MRSIAILSGILALLLSVCAFGEDDPIFNFQPVPGEGMPNKNAVREANGITDELLCYFNFDYDFKNCYGKAEYNGQPMNGVSIDSTGGRFGGAAYFERANSEYITVESPAFVQGLDHTYSAWYKLGVSDITGDDRYFVLETTGADGAAAYSASYGLREYAGTDIGQVMTLTSTLSTRSVNIDGVGGTEWHNIIVMYDASEARHYIYLDGDSVTTMSSSSTLAEVAGLVIGSYRGKDDRFWEGWIDEVAIWRRTLTADEIAAIQTRHVYDVLGPGILYAPSIEYYVGQRMLYIQAVDIENDGDKDLAMVTGNSLELLKNDNGEFSAPIRYPTGKVSYAFCSGDFDDDGFIDFAITDYFDGSEILIFRNDGDGTFDSTVIFSTGSTDRKSGVIMAADFDNDGDDDLAVANRETQNVRILINGGNMTFSSLQSYTVGYDPCGMTFADFNGDGYIDIAVGRNNSSWLVRILFNQGGANAGTFTLSGSVIEQVNPIGSICASDLDGDGDIDMAIPLWPSHIKVFYNDGTGTFGPPDLYMVGYYHWTICAADLDGDGDNDLVTCNEGSDNTTVLLNNGDLTFSEEGTYSVGNGPYYMCLEDLDGDYDIDMAVANYFSRNVSVLMNQSGPYEVTCCYEDNACQMLTIDACLADGGTPGLPGESCEPQACLLPDNSCVTLAPACCLLEGGIPQGEGTQCELFSYASDIATMVNTWDIVSAELNNLPGLDMVSVGSGGSVDVMLNTGVGSFAYTTSSYGVPFGGLPLNGGLAVADLDNDGDNDFAVSYTEYNSGEGYFDYSIFLFRNQNNGEFQMWEKLKLESPSYYEPIIALSLCAADFDGDGNIDLAANTVHHDNDTIYVLIMDGNGNIESQSEYIAGDYSQGIIAAELDNLPGIDLAVMHRDGITALLNDGSGAFTTANTLFGEPLDSLLWPDNIIKMATADINTDGFVDLLCPVPQNGVVLLLENNMDGTFTEREEFAGSPLARSVVTHDFDGDGDIDFLNTSSDAMSIHQNKGDGTFHLPMIYPLTTHDLRHVTGGDLDNNGGYDIAVTNSDGISLYRNGSIFMACDVNPSYVDFGELEIDNADTISVTIKNTGTILLDGSTTLAGEDADAFTLLNGGVPSDTIPYSLAPGDSLVVDVVFTATTGGAKTCYIETGLETCDAIFCTGSGPVVDFAIGGLQVIANESVPTGTPGEYELSGEVNIGGLLYFPDSTIINTNLGSLSSVGAINIKTNVSWFEWVTIYNNPLTIYASDGALGFDGLEPPVGFNLAGLDVAVKTLVFINGGIVVKGGLKMPEELPFYADPEDTANCYGGGVRIDSLEITRDNIVFNGRIIIPEFEVGAVSFSNGEIQLYTDSCGGIFGEDQYGNPICGSLYGGQIYVDIKGKFEVGGGVQFVDGHLNKIQVEATWPTPVWIDATGLGINGASGNIEHFAPADTYPLTIDLRTQIVGGPKIGDDYLVVFDSAGLLFKNPPFSLEASCNISILDKVDMGWSSVLYENSSLSLTGARNLFDIYDMSYSAHISTSTFYGNANGSLKTPGGLPWWLDFAENINLGSFSADINSSYIRGKARLNLGRFCVNYYFGKKCWNISSGFAAKIAFKKNFPYYDFYLGTNYSNLTEVIKRRDGNALNYTFFIHTDSIPATSEVLCYVRQKTQPLPEFYLINPDGDTLNQDDLPYMESVSSGDSIYFAMYYLEDPISGNWTAVAVGASEDCEIVFKSPNSPPSIHLTEPSEPGDAPTIAWLAQDFDDNADITFYFDDDNDGFDGLPINTVPAKEDSRSGSIIWDTEGIEPGEYYIYGIIDDTLNAPIRLYAPGTIIVEPPVQIPVPTGLQGNVVDDVVQLTWSPVPEQTQYAAFYRNVGKLDSEPAIGAVTDSTECSIEGLVGGRTYEFTVAAVSDSGQVGETSDPVVLTYVSPDYNNPTISSNDPPSHAYVGRAYQHCFSVEDLDAGDVFDLTFFRRPDGMFLSGTCLNWTPAPGQDGVAFIDLRAIDRNGNSDTLAFSIEVLDTSVTVPRVYFNSNTYQGEDDEGYITLEYLDVAHSDTLVDTALVMLTSTSDHAGIEVICVESSPSSNEFTAMFAFNTKASQKNPPQILVASGDRVMVEVPQVTEDDMAIIDNAVWYAPTRYYSGLDMAIQPDKWSPVWLEASQDKKVFVPSLKVILSVQDTSLSVDRIKIENLRLNGMIAPLRGSRLVIDSTTPNPSLIIEFDAMLAMYSMRNMSDGSNHPVSLSGLLVDNTPFCAKGAVTIGQFTGLESTDETESLPKTYSLSQNKPNPFNMNTVIDFAIPMAGHVELNIYNILGEQVTILTSQHYESGTYTIGWDGTDRDGYGVASGIYFYQLKTDTYIETRKMLLLK